MLFLNSKTVRLPRYLCERLISIRNAKVKLERQGITPSVDVSSLLKLLIEEHLFMHFSFYSANQVQITVPVGILDHSSIIIMFVIFGFLSLIKPIA